LPPRRTRAQRRVLPQLELRRQHQLQPPPLKLRQILRLPQCHLARSTFLGPIIRTTRPDLRWSAPRITATAFHKLRLYAQTSPRIRIPDYPGRVHTTIWCALTMLEAIRPIRILRVPLPTADTCVTNAIVNRPT